MAGLAIAAGLVWLTNPAQAVVRVGDSEIQVVYEMQHAFQFDGSPGDNFEWVQWRNELRVEYEYQDLVSTEGGLFGKNIKIPGVRARRLLLHVSGAALTRCMKSATNTTICTPTASNSSSPFTFPENGFREMNLGRGLRGC